MTSGYHIGAVASKVSGFDDDEDWPWFKQDAWYDEESYGYYDWYPSEAEIWPVDEAPWPAAENQGSWICGVTRHESVGVHDLMIDSGSQSTAVRPGFAPEYEIDDSEIPLLWDIREKQIKAYGRKIVRCEFAGDDETVLEGCIGVDVAEVGKDVASMGRILRAGFDMHYTNYGHTCWMERSGIRSTICEDDPNAVAPIYHLRFKVLPPTEILPSGCMVSVLVQTIVLKTFLKALLLSSLASLLLWI
jgi:hypothetical protein